LTRPPHAPVLWLLLFLFALRVVAQPLSFVMNAPWLPPFEAWQSGAVPYPFLLASQMAILAVFVPGTRDLAGGVARLTRRTGILLLALGSTYFMGMVVRLTLGLTTMRGHSWFDRPIPTFFHLVLAVSVLVYGHFQYRYGKPQ
jgi:hypothetical protein